MNLRYLFNLLLFLSTITHSFLAGAGQDAIGSLANKPLLADTATGSTQGQLIESILITSGMKDGLERLPDQIIASALETFQQSKPLPAAQESFRKLMMEAYPKQSFINGVTDALKRNYNEARYKRYLGIVSTATAKRMVLLEKDEPTPESMQRYLAQLQGKPLSADRIALIKSLDKASGASSLFSRIQFSNVETMALASLGECPDPAAVLKLRKSLADTRSELENQVTATVLIMMAYTYRDATDAELKEYVAAHNNPDARFVNKIAMAAYEGQFKAGSESIALNMSKFLEATKKERTMFAKTSNCGRPALQATAQKSEIPEIQRVSRAHLDARECLEFENPREVMVCAERFR